MCINKSQGLYNQFDGFLNEIEQYFEVCWKKVQYSWKDNVEFCPILYLDKWVLCTWTNVERVIWEEGNSFTFCCNCHWWSNKLNIPLTFINGGRIQLTLSLKSTDKFGSYQCLHTRFAIANNSCLYRPTYFFEIVQNEIISA